MDPEHLEQLGADAKGMKQEKYFRARPVAPHAFLWFVATLALSPSGSGLDAQAPARAPAAQSQFKGVFEPVSYTEDIDLRDVFFVNANVGWAAGKLARSSALPTAALPGQLSSAAIPRTRLTTYV